LKAQYALLLNCSTGGSVTENEGVFDSVTWVSATNDSCPNPNTAPLAANVNDQITFAVQVKDGNGVVQTGWLNWMVVMLTAATTHGNRGNRKADNNSPFRIGGGSKPNTVLLANQAGAGGTLTFTAFNGSGTPQTGGPDQGFPYMAAVKDIPPGASSPNRAISEYEATVVASVTDASGNLWQFGFDPEVDVNNNSNR
jgi:hypothetical protein